MAILELLESDLNVATRLQQCLYSSPGLTETDRHNPATGMKAS